MRIQEMRSGILHLKKKMENERPENIFETRPARERILSPLTDDAPLELFASELDEPRWSVISFERIEAAGLTYRQATQRMTDLDSQAVHGLCIVTDEAAARIKS